MDHMDVVMSDTSDHVKFDYHIARYRTLYRQKQTAIANGDRDAQVRIQQAINILTQCMNEVEFESDPETAQSLGVFDGFRNGQQTQAASETAKSLDDVIDGSSTGQQTEAASETATSLDDVIHGSSTGQQTKAASETAKSLDVIDGSTTRENTQAASDPTTQEQAAPTRVKKKVNRRLFDDATPGKVDIRLLGAVDLSVEELLTFFPLHWGWKEWLERLIAAGWKYPDIASYIVYARGLDITATVEERKAQIDTLRNTISREWSHMPLFHQTVPATQDFTAQAYTPSQGALRLSKNTGPFDYPLVRLAQGVVRWPQGEGARFLTAAVRHALGNDKNTLQLRDVEDMHQYLPSPSRLTAASNPDAAALTRFRQVWDQRYPPFRARPRGA